MTYDLKPLLLSLVLICIACNTKIENHNNHNVTPPKVVQPKTYTIENVSPPITIPVSKVRRTIGKRPAAVAVPTNVYPAKAIILHAVVPRGTIKKYAPPEVTIAIDSPYLATLPETVIPIQGELGEHSGSFTSIKASNGLISDETSSVIQDRNGKLWISSWWGGLTMYDGQSIRNYTRTQGLSSDIVNCVYEDRKGNIWIGTFIGGVNKLDGKYITRYSVAEGLGDSAVFDIREDAKGNMWLATNRGLCKFDGRSFTRFTTAQGLPSDKIESIMVDRKGFIWVGFAGGLARFDGSAFVNYTSHLNFRKETLVSCVIEDRHGNIWFGTDSGLYKHTGREIHLYNTDGGLSSNIITSLFEDNNGDIWIGTASGGINKFDGVAFSHFRVADGLPGDNITSINQDNRGNIWVTTRSGICKYDAEVFSHIFPLQQDEIEPVLADSKGNVWMASGAGSCVNRFDGKSLFRYTTDNGLATTSINQMIEDKKGNIWIATWNGVNMYDGKSFVHYTKDDGLPDNVVFTLVEDPAGCIWFGTIKGLSKFDGKSFTNFGVDQGLCTEMIITMATDNNGIVWLGTTDRGVCSFDGKFFTHYDFSKTLGHAYVAGIAKDNQNNMWFATSNGVNKFDGKNFMSYSTEQGLSSNITKNVIQDRAGNIWVGTMNGLNRLVEPRNGDPVARFKKYTATEGFSGRGTYDHSISVNADGDLWIGANDRVTRYHPMHDIPDTIPPAITLTDITVAGEKIDWMSLPNNDTPITLKSGAALKAEFASLSPWYNLPQNLRLSHDNNNLTFQFNGITTQRPYEVKYYYMLDELENNWNITGHHTATYTNIPPGDFTFKVKAVNSEGYASDELAYPFTIYAPWWRTPWAYASYVILLVMAAWLFAWYRSRWLKQENVLLEEKVSKKTSELQQSFEERLLLSKQIESQQALINERLRISRELHDDIGSTLGSISIYSEVARKRAGKKENPDVALTKIGTTSRELIEKMNDIIWSLNLNAESFQQLQDRMQSFAALMLAPKNIRYTFHVDDHSKSVQLTSVQAKNIFLIYKEALHNIVKYARCRNIAVRFCGENKLLTMIIEDDGEGFDGNHAEQRSGGNGLKNMEARAVEINARFECSSTLQQGTTIFLAVPL